MRKWSHGVFLTNPSLNPLGCVQSANHWGEIRCVQSANHWGDIQLKQKLNLFSSKPTQKQIDVSSV
jgi:hypothetical protein